MNRRTCCLGSFLLVVALAVPSALRAKSTPAGSPHSTYQQRDDRPPQGRVYDPAHRDWHDWNDNEERSYRQYLAESHKDYRDFSRLNERDQSEYWNWRHGHPDRDDRNARGDRPPDRDNRGNGAGRRYYDQNTGQYHDWNDNEELAYREFMKGRNWPYRDITILLPRDQQRYWDWRHKHPDRDRDRH